MITSTGSPFSSVGVHFHCRAAAMAALSRSGIERRTSAAVIQA
jgi:hypothetical protein